MKEKDFGFDERITDQLSEIIPPEYEIDNINPWSKPIGFITWGLILMTLHLNFLYLQYVLPTIGVILIFLGFRSLRNVNIYFKILWFLSMVKLIQKLGGIIVEVTPLNMTEYPEVIIGIVALVFQIAIFLIFHKGLKEVYKKAERQMEKSPLILASFWSVGAFLIAISPLSQSWIIFVPMIILYILIVRSLFSVGNQLDDTGYVLTNAPVKIDGATFGRTYFLITLAVVIGCNIYFNHLRLEPKEYLPPNTNETRQHLLDMGISAEALQYLNDQEVEMLKDAKCVEAFDKLLMFDPTRVEHKEGSPGSMIISHTYDPGKKNMKASTIYVEMPDNTMYVMQYFIWVNGRPIWQDGIVIHGAYSEDNFDSDRERDKDVVSSSLFYKKNGIEYTADFPRLTWESVEVSSMFGTYYSQPIKGALSYPFGSKDQGGYVLYRYSPSDVEDDIFFTYCVLNYVHRLSPLGIPYFRTEDRMLSGGYEIIDELNQHYTTYESQALRESISE